MYEHFAHTIFINSVWWRPKRSPPDFMLFAKRGDKKTKCYNHGTFKEKSNKILFKLTHPKTLQSNFIRLMAMILYSSTKWSRFKKERKKKQTLWNKLFGHKWKECIQLKHIAHSKMLSTKYGVHFGMHQTSVIRSVFIIIEFFFYLKQMHFHWK